MQIAKLKISLAVNIVAATIMISKILYQQVTDSSVRNEQEERAHAELKISLAVNIVAATIMTAQILYQQVKY